MAASPFSLAATAATSSGICSTYRPTASSSPLAEPNSPLSCLLAPGTAAGAAARGRPDLHQSRPDTSSRSPLLLGQPPQQDSCCGAAERQHGTSFLVQTATSSRSGDTSSKNSNNQVRIQQICASPAALTHPTWPDPLRQQDGAPVQIQHMAGSPSLHQQANHPQIQQQPRSNQQHGNSDPAHTAASSEFS